MEISMNNQDCMEQVVFDMQKEQLKFCLVMEYASKKKDGFSEAVVSLLYEVYGNMETYVHNLDVLSGCLSSGQEMDMDVERRETDRSEAV